MLPYLVTSGHRRLSEAISHTKRDGLFFGLAPPSNRGGTQ